MYQSYRQQTQTVEQPSRSGSLIGGILGGIAGLALAPLTAGTSLAVSAGTGFGIGSALGSGIGGAVASDSVEVPVGGAQYGTSMSAAQQPQPATVYPLPMEDPRQYKQRLAQVFRDSELEESRTYYGA